MRECKNIRTNVISFINNYTTHSVFIISMICICLPLEYFKNTPIIDIIINIIFSLIAAEIFYIYTILVPKHQQLKKIYNISISLLSSEIDGFLNCLYQIYNNHGIKVEEINAKNLYSYEDSINTSLDSEMWNLPYKTYDWKLYRRRAENMMFSGYGKTYVHLISKETITYKQKFIMTIESIELQVSNVLARYGSVLELDYIILLEQIVNCPLVIYKDLNQDKYSRYVYNGANCKSQKMLVV